VNIIDYKIEPQVVEGSRSHKEIDDVIIKPLNEKPNIKYIMALGLTLTMLGIGAGCLGYTFYKGIGVWGNNNPVGWAFDIVNFVFWIGIGHAGTLISAILFLFMQKLARERKKLLLR
jgi:molybdopterin-containing oxidoreductase family membrane subunit